MSEAEKSDGMQMLKMEFPGRIVQNVFLSRFTSARLGGPAEWIIEVHSKDELVKVVKLCAEYEIPFIIIGGGSNVLVSDKGIKGLVILNRARAVHFNQQSSPPTVWAESGVNIGSLARRAAQKGLSGLEWAAGIPGTVGGAVVGNAGAHGGDIAGCLTVAEILQLQPENNSSAYSINEWDRTRLDFNYRSSALKRQAGVNVVLSATFALEVSDQQSVLDRIKEFTQYRHKTQPPGASMGSMFKNPPGDYAGRLIELAGLKGARIGDAQISPLHANFFINLGQATAKDVFQLIELARNTVLEKFGVSLELEIELVGEW